MPKRHPPLRHLLCGPEESASYAASTSSLVPQKRQRVGTQMACNECRRKKARCDGERPCCRACQQRSVPCIYADKPAVGPPIVDESCEIVQVLRSASESEAFGILRLLRTNDDLSAVAHIVKSMLGLRQSPAENASETAVGLQEAPYPSLEFELMTKNPVSYPALHPLFASSLEECNLLGPVQLHRPDSRDARFAFESVPSRLLLLIFLSIKFSSQVVGASPEAAIETTDSDPARTSDDPALNPFLSSYGPDEIVLSRSSYCDERLRDLDIAFWTNVPVTNEFAARVISLYLETDHPLLGTFDPDLFIGDLVARQTRHCSRLLANATLYWGSQMYAAIDRDAYPQAQLFCVEAERLWRLEGPSDTLLNIASAQLLSLATLGQGKDHHMLEYLGATFHMGLRMSLFGVEPAVGIKMVNELPRDMRSATSYAAWGTFNWIVLMSLFYQQPGVQYPNHPPELPIPGVREPVSTPHKEHSAKGPGLGDPALATAPYMGETFPALCMFWRILHGVTRDYYQNAPKQPAPASGHVSLVFAEHKYRELLAWAETLPKSLALSEDSAHHVVVFHVWFHAAILDIFRPFVRGPEDRLATFAARESCPRVAFKASVEQLKSLVVIYRSRHKESAYSILWHTGMIYLANAVLHEPKDPAWRFYFLHCVHGYGSLRRSYRVAEAVGRALLTMTLRSGDMSSDEARSIFGRLKKRGLAYVSDEIRATFMVDLDLAMTDPDDSSVEKLAQGFEDWTLFREFTHLDG
ncbi:fungal zn(2)-Cys(6) binuclear cluster domain-containing protein [Hirsutella rhossiliensis]|uniref:Fungal zn(2)-Cys(6) binuclear cluster domain-containing protein n=1 Tax=Hirsutella rhossiliensis TaxID=111463 RepID=A0A9P8SFF9_9HYPO|nr:fungal zn(2)-Cys(6) binuclear cluster domain-containing protein [Hirsutella rhossiliensis]KAH0960004.1 fungal zn(2)-Cys(6) binuclear cluster domain-containing protein [Hirsutella rhossiliensis]